MGPSRKVNNYSIWCVLMPTGFQLFNNDYISVIDDNFFNLCLAGKGSAVTSNNPNYSYVDVTLACRQPTIAFKCTTGFAYILTQKNNGNGTWTFRFGASTANQTIRYWLFDTPPPDSSSTSGMQVFNASRALVFDANYKYLSPVAFYQNTDGTLIGNDVTLNGTAGRQYAVVQNYMSMIQYVGEETPGGSGGGTIYNVSMEGSSARFASDSSLILGMRQIYYAVTGTIAFRGGGGTASYLLVDVTDF